MVLDVRVVAGSRPLLLGGSGIVGIFYLIFAIIIVPILFFMFTWTMVTAYRLLFPERPSAFRQDMAFIRRRRVAPEDNVLVGVREIREDQRRHRNRQFYQGSYNYVHGTSMGFPDAWYEDLTLRRN